MTDTEILIKMLKRGVWIDKYEFYSQTRSMSLAQRIKDVRDLGYNIETKIKKNPKKHWTAYRLKKSK